MLPNLLSRREFLSLAGLGLTGLAMRPVANLWQDLNGAEVARIATTSVSVYNKPDDESTILYQRTRDELVNVYYELTSEFGPGYNPIWYRVWRGYIHSAHLQKVKVCLNPVVEEFPETGQLAEVTVPFTPTMRYNPWLKTWEPLYRLYYQSHHWVRGVDVGPDGEPWYRLHDELLEINYHARAEHFRLVQPEEFDPISPDVPSHHKRIEVSIRRQEMKAYEGDKVALECRVSTGIPGMNSPGQTKTATPIGDFYVYSKMPSKHMGNGALTSDIEAYELPGVPWTTFFQDTGVAIHGTYWHRNYGIQMSRGCVNVPVDIAKWVYRWTYPVAAPETWEQRGHGTLITVEP